LYYLAPGSRIAPYNSSVPDASGQVWVYDRQGESIFTPLFVPNSTRDYLETAGTTGGGVSLSADGKVLSFGAGVVPWPLTHTYTAFDTTANAPLFFIHTGYMDPATDTEVNCLAVRDDLPKNSIWSWHADIEASIEIDWTNITSSAVGDEVSIEIFWSYLDTDGVTTVLRSKKFRAAKMSGRYSGEVVSNLTLSVPLGTEVSFTAILRGTKSTTAWAGSTGVEINFTISKPYASFIDGSTIPYSKVTYKKHGDIKYSKLAGPEVTFLELFGEIDRDDIDDPVCNVIPMWINRASIDGFGNILNLMILQIEAYSTAKTIDINGKYRKITGNTDFVISNMAIIHDWPIYGLSPFTGLTLDQKTNLLQALLQDVSLYGEGITTNSGIADFFDAVVSLS
jgi:hypothetical protein